MSFEDENGFENRNNEMINEIENLNLDLDGEYQLINELSIQRIKKCNELRYREIIHNRNEYEKYVFIIIIIYKN